METLRQSDATTVVVMYDNAAGDTTVRNNISIDSRDMRVTSYEKNSSRADLLYVDAGVLAMRRSVIAYLPQTGSASLEEEVFPKLISNGKLLGHVTTSRFYDIGTPDRLRAFEAFITHDHYANAL
jgi:NDP-sugar pyrophosphorylase family protein